MDKLRLIETATILRVPFSKLDVLIDVVNVYIFLSLNKSYSLFVESLSRCFMCSDAIKLAGLHLFWAC